MSVSFINSVSTYSNNHLLLGPGKMRNSYSSVFGRLFVDCLRQASIFFRDSDIEQHVEGAPRPMGPLFFRLGPVALERQQKHEHYAAPELAQERLFVVYSHKDCRQARYSASDRT